MSAIWGAISMNKKALPKEISAVLSAAYQNCVIDRVEELTDNGIYMACGIQYFTSEAEREQLPVRKDGVWFTADVVLDNRDELMNHMQIPVEEQNTLPDGEILRRIYQKEGNNCLNDLLGAYAFVNYREQDQRVDIVIDCVGTRVVYYTLYQDVLYFSSLLAPLAKITKARLNDRWMVDFLALDYLAMINEAVETPYENIYRIAPNYRLVCENGKLSNVRYWDPVKTVRKLKLKSDEDYKEAFRNLFFEAVQSMMRYDERHQLSAMLSGGYDSTAVVSVASRHLTSKKDKIFTYTSVPLASYSVKEDHVFMEDETESVRETADFLGNLEPYFIDMPGVDGWNGRFEAMRNIEMPYKSPQNLLWMPECMKQARLKGSRIMLTGSYGNTTISFTEFKRYMNELLLRFRFVKFEQELNQFQKVMNFDKRYARKRIIKDLLKSKWKAVKIEKNKKVLFKNSYARNEMLQKTNAASRMRHLNKRYIKAAYNHRIQKFLINQETALRQIGEIEEKFTLYTGVLLRDPTRDKRILEFCMSLPISQFIKDGEERRLVSVYLKDIMPPSVLNSGLKGKQSADFCYRLSLRWDEIRREWMTNYRETADSLYVDTQTALHDLEEKPDIGQYRQFDLVRHLYTQLLLDFEKEKSNSFVRIRDK